MTNLDVSKGWVILIPGESGVVRTIGEDLARLISLLRSQAGLSLGAPPVLNSSRETPDESVPIMLLNTEGRENTLNGFSWRLGNDRLEILGVSNRGLCNGVYHFLGALGFRWLRPDREELPRPLPGYPAEYALSAPSAYQPSAANPQKWRRMVITRETSPRDRDLALLWAARNCVDAVVLPLHEQATGIGALFRKSPSKEGVHKAIERYAFIVEAGGWDLSLILPRRYFLFHRDLFRMDGGKRVKNAHFCPTNPDSQGIFREVLREFLQESPGIPVLHLWPDRNQGEKWCSCPTCRAFSPEEQNRIAVNAAADIAGGLNGNIRLSYYENSEDPVQITPRANTFPLKYLPGQPGAENLGLYLAEEWRREPFHGTHKLGIRRINPR